MSSKKIYITADQLLEDAFELGMRVVESDFRPTFIIAVWRGGTPIGIAVQEVLDICGIKTNHIAVRTSSYTGIDQRQKQVRVHGLAYAIETLCTNDHLLIVDDVHDSGHSVAELARRINDECGENKPEQIKLATVYYKPKRSQVDHKPDFYLHETHDWLVFPHELVGLTDAELMHAKPGFEDIGSRLLAYKNK